MTPISRRKPASLFSWAMSLHKGFSALRCDTDESEIAARIRAPGARHLAANAPAANQAPPSVSPLVQCPFKVYCEVEVEVLEHRLEVSWVQGARGAALRERGG